MKKTVRTNRIVAILFAMILATAIPAWSLTIPPTLQDELTGNEISEGTRNLVICIHGWNNPVNVNHDRYTESEWVALVAELKLALPKTGSDPWALLLYHWEDDAATGLIDGINPFTIYLHGTQAALNAATHGISLGPRLPTSLRRVQFITHSAGAWCAYRAAYSLMALNPYVTVEITLLDPYIPNSVPGYEGVNPDMSTATIGSMKDWSFSSRLILLENYFADDFPQWDDSRISTPTPATQESFSWRGIDINQEIDWGPSIVNPPHPTHQTYYDWHSGPILFYADTMSAVAGYPPPSLPTGSPYDYHQRGWYQSLYYRTQQGQLPKITTQPVGQSSTASSVVLSVAASGSGALAYQWFRNNSLIIGANSSTYTVNTTTDPPTPYVVRVTDGNGNSFFSDQAIVAFYSAPPPPTVPSIASVSPSTLPTSASAQLINVYGSNFKAAGDANVSTLIFRDPANNIYARTPVFVSSSQLQYNITVQNAVGTWSVTVTNAGQAASNLQTFQVAAAPPNTGSLTVNLSPAGAVSAGAQWRVDGGSYRNTGDTATSLTPGAHTVSFKAISGYTTPADQTVTITSGANTTGSGTYSAIAASTYTLTINYNPTQGGASPSPLVAQTSSTYGSYSFEYTANATTLVQASASAGYHFTGWSGDASGLANPITVTMNANKNVTANFAAGDPNLGTLTVTIQPPEAVTAGVTWGFNETDFRASGSGITTYPMNSLIYVHTVSGWSGAGVYPVTIIAGQTTNYTVAVSSTTGSTVGIDPRIYYTFAGLAKNTGSTDGTNSVARFSNPWHIAADTAGNVYVADYGNHTIRKITPEGIVSTLAGLAGSSGSADGTGSNARFNMPIGVAADTNGNVYVGEYGNSTIRKITPGGVVSTFAGLAGNTGSADSTGSAARFKNPTGVAVDGSGNVYVADYGNYTIRKITPGGVVSTLAGSAGSHATTDGVGTAARFFYPSGITVDNTGDLYVSDTFNHTIRKITSGGNVSTLAGFPGSGGAADGSGTAARFSYPEELAVDSIGNVYVADNNNSIIRKITPAGLVSTLAGLSGHYGTNDGNGNSVRFQFATGVAIDNAGKLYVADNGNSTIRATQSSATKYDQTIVFGPLNDKFINDPPFAVTAAASSALPVTFSIMSGPATLSNNVVILTGSGTVTVRATQAGDSTFNAATNVDRSFVVAKLPQTITFGALSRQVFGDAPFTLSASASSGLPVSFSVLSGPAVLSGKILTLTGAGLVVLRASQAGNATNAPAPNVDQVLIVVPGNNVITDFQRLANGMFTFRFYGEPSTNYVVQASTNLVQWVALATNQISGLGYLEFTDTAATNFSKRFYRIAPPGAAASGAPLLSIMLSGNKVVVLWPTNDAAFKLEYATNLPAATWISNSITPAIVSGRYAVTNSATNKFRFYRLKK